MLKPQTDAEILEYASWLGIDLDTEQVRPPHMLIPMVAFPGLLNPLHTMQELLYIARQGLKAPLPEDWKPW